MSSVQIDAVRYSGKQSSAYSLRILCAPLRFKKLPCLSALTEA
jgi:hypothetical protein